MVVTINGQKYAYGEGFDELAIQELGKNAVQGKVPVYVKECHDGESFFFSLQPITLTQQRMLLICENGE